MNPNIDNCVHYLQSDNRCKKCDLIIFAASPHLKCEISPAYVQQLLNNSMFGLDPHELFDLEEMRVTGGGSHDHINEPQRLTAYDIALLRNVRRIAEEYNLVMHKLSLVPAENLVTAQGNLMRFEPVFKGENQ